MMVQRTMEHDPALRTVRFAGCFGWLHTPSNGLSNNIAVVMCPGLSIDGLTGYRPIRVLAVALANAGFPTLRFDYPSTGNSSDTDNDDIWQIWQDSIHAAIDWLRYHGLADRVVLCGLRAGATLAMEVALTRTEVTDLMLLEPILRGRSYLRQLSIEAGSGAAAPLSGPFAVHELTFSTKTCQRVSQIDLRLLQPASSCRIGVFTQASTKLLEECIAAWRASGVIVERLAFNGLQAMLRPVLMSHMASIDATSVLTWLSSLLPVTSTIVTPHTLPAETALLEEAFTETAVRFGTRQAMFGILCEPVQPSAASIAVVITNSSGNPASGFGRFGVDLARSLAAAGVASLRMDFMGLGDSVDQNDKPTHIFEADRRRELRLAVDLLTTRGYRRIAIQGLCSGAYHALQSAFADPRVGTLLLVNLQHFSWDAHDRVELKGYALRRPTYFLKKLASRAVWIDLICGKLNVAGIVAVLLARITDELRRLGSSSVKRLTRETDDPTTILDHMRILSLRAKTLFLMSEGDEGVAVLSREFGPALAVPGAFVQIVPGLDHALSSAVMRRVVIERSIAFLEDHVGLNQAAPGAHLEASVAERPPDALVEI